MWWLDDVTATWDPFAELRRLRREVDRLFGEYGTEREEYPPLNVWANDESVVVTAELPGLSAEDIHVSVQGDQFTLEGEKKAEEPAEDVVCHRRERGAGRFSRTIRLPYGVDADRVAARYQRGVLTVTLPRTEASKPKRIAISAE